MKRLPLLLLQSAREKFRQRKLKTVLTKKQISAEIEVLRQQRAEIAEEINRQGLSVSYGNTRLELCRWNKLFLYLQQLRELSQRINRLRKQLPKAPSGE